MNLMGRDIPVGALLSRIEERLQLRGLREAAPSRPDAPATEARVDPLTFNLGALEQHSDPTRPLPLHTHRGGAGQVVLLAKWAFRKSCQVFINEAFSRQKVFNSHVRDSYAQLSSEVLRLRRELDAVKAQAAVKAQPAVPPAAPSAKKGSPVKRKSTASPKPRRGK